MGFCSFYLGTKKVVRLYYFCSLQRKKGWCSSFSRRKYLWRKSSKNSLRSVCPSEEEVGKDFFPPALLFCFLPCWNPYFPWNNLLIFPFLWGHLQGGAQGAWVSLFLVILSQPSMMVHCWGGCLHGPLEMLGIGAYGARDLVRVIACRTYVLTSWPWFFFFFCEGWGVGAYLVVLRINSWLCI